MTMFQVENSIKKAEETFGKAEGIDRELITRQIDNCYAMSNIISTQLNKNGQMKGFRELESIRNRWKKLAALLIEKRKTL